MISSFDVANSGNVWAWGVNSYGLLGFGKQITDSRPQ
ncbi:MULTISPECIES: RCC1 domain-containing protein [unclassified Paenibacillus]